MNKVLFGTSHNEYIIELTYDGSMYHYFLRGAWSVLHHFVAPFDTEHEARQWAGDIARNHLEQVEAGTI